MARQVERGADPAAPHVGVGRDPLHVDAAAVDVGAGGRDGAPVEVADPAARPGGVEHPAGGEEAAVGRGVALGEGAGEVAHGGVVVRLDDLEAGGLRRRGSTRGADHERRVAHEREPVADQVGGRPGREERPPAAGAVVVEGPQRGDEDRPLVVADRAAEHAPVREEEGGPGVEAAHLRAVEVAGAGGPTEVDHPRREPGHVRVQQGVVDRGRRAPPVLEVLIGGRHRSAPPT